MSFCQSTFLPSLAHSRAHLSATSSGRGFSGLRTTSTLNPITSSAHLECPFPGIRRRPTGEKGAQEGDRVPGRTAARFRLRLESWRYVPWLLAPNLRCRGADGAFYLQPAWRRVEAALFTSLPPTPVVLAVCESTMAALGLGSLPRRHRRRSRSSAFSRSKVPTLSATS